MLTTLILLAAVGPLPPPVFAPPQDGGAVQEAASPADRLHALEKEYDDAMAAFYAAYSKASEEERQKIFADLYPDPDAFVPRFQALADEVLGTDTAAGALAWIATHANDEEVSGEALTTLIEDHLESPRIKSVCQLLERRYGDGEELLLRIMDRSPDHDTQGMACFTLASNLLGQSTIARNIRDEEKKEVYIGWLGQEVADRLLVADPAALQARAEKLFERVIAEFGDVDTGYAKLGPRAEANLFEIHHLQIGMVAPDIEGTDVDGTAFKLSDYRGKVVVIDFWGNW